MKVPHRTCNKLGALMVRAADPHTGGGTKQFYGNKLKNNNNFINGNRHLVTITFTHVFSLFSKKFILHTHTHIHTPVFPRSTISASYRAHSARRDCYCYILTTRIALGLYKVRHAHIYKRTYRRNRVHTEN